MSVVGAGCQVYATLLRIASRNEKFLFDAGNYSDVRSLEKVIRNLASQIFGR